MRVRGQRPPAGASRASASRTRTGTGSRAHSLPAISDRPWNPARRGRSRAATARRRAYGERRGRSRSPPAPGECSRRLPGRASHERLRLWAGQCAREAQRASGSRPRGLRGPTPPRRAPSRRRHSLARRPRSAPADNSGAAGACRRSETPLAAARLAATDSARFADPRNAGARRPGHGRPCGGQAPFS